MAFETRTRADGTEYQVEMPYDIVTTNGVEYHVKNTEIQHPAYNARNTPLGSSATTADTKKRKLS